MKFQPTTDNHVFCWLRQHLEPRFRVISLPDPAYGAESRFCYRIFDEDQLLHELSGDFLHLPSGSLIRHACSIVQTLSPLNAANGLSFSASTGRPMVVPSRESGVIASRLKPLSTDRTYFSSGRAAFCFLISHVVRPQRIWLPTFVAGSLVSAALQKMPGIELKFYSINRQLQLQSGFDPDPADAVVLIHYFGQVQTPPDFLSGNIVLNDLSHLLRLPELPGYASFGSLRKIFRIADGGVVLGNYQPAYESDLRLPVWLRRNARDWTDLREAENMMERDWVISDMSSQSLEVIRGTDINTVAELRIRQEQLLSEMLTVGQRLQTYADGEVPLLHNRTLSSVHERDSLRSFLAARGVYCSIHWPLHPELLRVQDQVDVSEAAWLADHILSIPISEDFTDRQLEQICGAFDAWKRQS
jgi:hypothetical protein